MKIGILGAGRIGRVHAENITRGISDVEIKVVADPYANENTQAWVERLGIKKLSKDPNDVFNDFEIDAVLICSSTDTHLQFIIEAAKVGKHIFCEKPIGDNIAGISEALDVVGRAGVKLQIGFVRRFDHNHKKVHDAVRKGEIGNPHIIKISSRDPEPPPLAYVKISGGIFFDMMIHDFDMARYIADSEVEEVYAHGAVLVDPAIGEAGDVDTAMVTLKFKNGALGVIDNSRKCAYGYDQRVEVFGSKGCVEDFNDTPSTTVLRTSKGVFSDKTYSYMFDRYTQAFIAEIKAFIDAINANTEPAVSGVDGLNAVLIAEAAKKSLTEGKPIRIDQI